MIRRTVASALALLLLGSLAQPAGSHIAEPTRTLRVLLGDARWAGRVRVSDARSQVRVGDRLTRPVVHAVVLETLKGSAPPGAVLRFAQHGHGSAEFQEGDDVLLFLQPIARHGELGRTRLVEALEWVSLQEHDARWLLSDSDGEAVLAAARAYATLGKLPVAKRAAELGRISVGLLLGHHERLASDAFRDLAPAPTVLIPGDDAVAALLAVADDESRDAGYRGAVIALLERRGLVDGTPRWLQLLRTTRGAEREVVIQRAAPRVPRSNALFAELQALLVGDDSRSAMAAALAIGTPGADAAVAPLSAALASSDSRLRGAAVRALGRVATPAARQALLAAAASHPDATTRRLAGATAARLPAPLADDAPG